MDAQSPVLEPLPVEPPGFGELARSFTAVTDGIPNYTLDVAAGRLIVLMMFGTLSAEICSEALKVAMRKDRLFNDHDACFFGVTFDPDDRNLRSLVNADFGVRYLWDFDRKAFEKYGLIRNGNLVPAIFLIDRDFRILMAENITETDKVMKRLEAELSALKGKEAEATAPVLVLPHVFEPDFCQTLLDYFHAHEPAESGFAAHVQGKTINVINKTLKRRQDVTIEDEALVQAVKGRLEARLFPMIKRAFGWQATRIERYLICRYSCEDHGFFLAHRDDVVPGAEHRRFAVSVNLNTGQYEGGTVRFPEFGRREYAAPKGGAAVFCTNLLHEVLPVTSGDRFTLVPFLFDEEGEKVRLATLSQVGPL